MCEETASNKVMILSKAIMVHTACGTKRIYSPRTKICHPKSTEHTKVTCQNL